MRSIVLDVITVFDLHFKKYICVKSSIFFYRTRIYDLQFCNYLNQPNVKIRNGRVFSFYISFRIPTRSFAFILHATDSFRFKSSVPNYSDRPKLRTRSLAFRIIRRCTFCAFAKVSSTLYQRVFGVINCFSHEHCQSTVPYTFVLMGLCNGFFFSPVSRDHACRSMPNVAILGEQKSRRNVTRSASRHGVRVVL